MCVSVQKSGQSRRIVRNYEVEPVFEGPGEAAGSVKRKYTRADAAPVEGIHCSHSQHRSAEDGKFDSRLAGDGRRRAADIVKGVKEEPGMNFRISLPEPDREAVCSESELPAGNLRWVHNASEAYGGECGIRQITTKTQRTRSTQSELIPSDVGSTRKETLSSLIP